MHPGIVDGELDVGRILESMLYYGRIDALVDGRVFPSLWQRLGPQGTRDLLTHPSLRVQITAETPIIYNSTRNGVRTHAPLFMSAAGRDERRKFDPHKDIAQSLHQLINNRNATPLAAVKKLVSDLPQTSFSKLLARVPTRGDLFESLISDSLSMQVFLKAFARSRGLAVNDDLLNGLRVTSIKTPDGFLIADNIDLNRIVSGSEPLDGWDQVLPLVHDYAHDLHFSQAYSADVITNEANSYIASQRIDLSIKRAMQVDDAKSSFEEFAFNEARPFREAFNAGELSLSEALGVIDKTAKFREWLNTLPPSADIIKEYHLAVNRETILGKLPGRGTRFAVFTGAGVALDIVATGGLGTAAAVSLSAFDSFVLDGLLKGWRPNHFVSTVKKAISSAKAS